MRRLAVPTRIRRCVLPVVLALASAPVGAATPAGGRLPTTPGQRASAKTPLQSLVAAEKAFAALSGTSGMRTAFLANLADDGVVFRPRAVNGRTSWEARPASKARLAWEPAYGEVAASGDFGFTTGPWEYHPAPGAAQKDAQYGEFLSVWRRDGRGPWKVVLDHGISHARPDSGLERVAFTEGPEHAPEGAADTTGMSGAAYLQRMDRQMTLSARSLGASSAVRMYLDRDLRYLREGQMPVKGLAASQALVAMVPHPRWIPDGGGLARSGDLGYTYGVREDSAATVGQPPDSSVYVHIWRRLVGGSWRIAAAVENPLKR